MFAVNYTLMKLEDALNFLTDWTTEPYRDLQGDQRRHRLAITTLVDLPFGPGKRDWPQHVRAGRRLDRGLAIQHDRRDSVWKAARAITEARCSWTPTSRSPESEQSFNRWFDNSIRALNNPRPDGTFAWSVLGPNEYRVVKGRFPDVNEPTEPQWSFSLFKNNRIGSSKNLQIRVEMFNVFNVRMYGRAQHGPSLWQLRDRGHGKPGEFPEDDPARGEDGVLTNSCSVRLPPVAPTTPVGLASRHARCASREGGQDYGGSRDLSLLSQRDDWVDAQGAPGGQVGGQERHGREKRSGGHQRRWICRRDAEQELRNRPRRRPGTKEAECDAGGNRRRKAPDNHAEHPSRRGAERDADANLMGTSGDGVGRQTEDSHRGEQHSETAQDRKERGPPPARGGGFSDEAVEWHDALDQGRFGQTLGLGSCRGRDSDRLRRARDDHQFLFASLQRRQVQLGQESRSRERWCTSPTTPTISHQSGWCRI